MDGVLQRPVVHHETDRDQETGQLFCLTCSKYVCVICYKEFAPVHDLQAKCMEDQVQNYSDYDPYEQLNLSSCEDSETECPQCPNRVLMKIVFSNELFPEDYITKLVCPECHYEETD